MGKSVPLRIFNLILSFLLLLPQLLVLVNSSNPVDPPEASAASSCTQTNWLDPAFIYRKKIVFDNSSATDALSSFPVMVKLTSSNFEFFKARSDGGDIRFTDSDGTTQLSYEIEKWDSATSDAVIWVTVPQIDASSSTDYIYMYFGNQNASTTQTVATGGVVRDSATARAAWPLDETTTTQSYSRVLNPAVATGRDIIINGTFDTDTLWTKGTGWTISGGVAVGTSVAVGQFIQQSAPIVSGKVYSITYTLTVTSGSIRPFVGGGTSGATQSTSGTYTDTILMTGATNIFFAPVTTFTGTIDNVTVTQLNIPANTAISATQLLTDGDMETAGTSAWTPQSSATLSKQTTSPHGGSQVLRVAYNGVANAGALQTVATLGQVYRVSGYARSDGTAIPTIINGQTPFTGTNSTAWQPFDFIYVATNTGLILRNSTSSGYVEFDDVVVSADNYIRQGELLQDGDMEQVGTTFWVTTNTSVTKQTVTQHGGDLGQVLRVSYNGTTNGWAYQGPNLTGSWSVGKTLRVTGWAKGDGTAVPKLAVTSSTAAIWTGTSSTSWQFIDAVFINDSATAPFLIRPIMSAAGFADFDDLSLTELDPLVGKPTNGVTLGSTANGHLTNAYTFDGSNDNVNIYSSDLNSVFNPSEGTIIAWAKVANSGVWTDSTSRYLIKFGVDASNNFLIQKYTANNTLRFNYIAGGINNAADITSLGGNTSWMMIVMSWSKSNDQVKLYGNGTQLGSTLTGLGTWTGNLISTGEAIGSNGSTGANPWSGMINDVRLYNSALSPSLISAYYKSGADTFNTINAEEGYKAACDAASAPPPPSVTVTPTPTATVRPIPYRIPTTVPATTQPLAPTGTSEPTPTPTSEPVTFKLPEIKFPRISFSLPQIQLPDLRPFFNSIGSGIASFWNGYMNLATALSLGTRDFLASTVNAGSAAIASIANYTRIGFEETVNELASLWGRYMNLATALGSGTRQFAFGIGTGVITFTKASYLTSADILDRITHYIKTTAEVGVLAFRQSLEKPKEIAINIKEWISYSATSFGEIVLDKEPTRIFDVKANQVSPTTAIITWRTNHLSTSKVNYGLTPDYGQDVSSTKKVHNHELKIEGLDPNTKYYYEVMSQNKNYVFDARHEFATPEE